VFVHPYDGEDRQQSGSEIFSFAAAARTVIKNSQNDHYNNRYENDDDGNFHSRKQETDEREELPKKGHNQKYERYDSTQPCENS
jgi:hypothetical protein